MVYVCELNPGHRVYLDNQGNQTTITTTVGVPGQLQQASNSMTTGPWTAPPKAYQNPGGATFTLFTAQGEIYICIQGNSISTTSAPGGAQQLSVQQTTTAMPTMQPMTMGTMQMTMQPMEMRMGNMELKMEAQSPAPQSPAPRQFCSQCGKKVASGDRFCSSCGHALS